MGGVTVDGKKYKLAVQYYDDESTPARTAQLLERLIEQDGVQYILGPYSSPTTIAAAPVVEKYKVPMVEAEGASRALFNKGRSEEHTSELQSLMRISYAVFCLKKKKNKTHNKNMYIVLMNVRHES